MYTSERSSRSIPTGPGSRGGHWHEPEYRREYARAWRAANPAYRERERLRRARAKAEARGEDPTLIVEPPRFPRPLPVAAAPCGCGCQCSEPVPTVCGFCRDGQHGD